MALGTKLGVIALSGVTATPFSNVYSLDFDGTDDYLEGGSNFTSLDGLEKATFSFWIKPTSSATTLRFLFNIGRSSTALNSQVEMWLYQGNRIQADINTSSAFIRGDISSITSFITNKSIIVSVISSLNCSGEIISVISLFLLCERFPK